MAENGIGKGGIALKVNCEIISDLIPLVKDKIASKESEILVLEHIDTCDRCRADYEMFAEIPTNSSQVEDQKIISSIKKNIILTQVIILVVGAILGIALTDTMGMFYNLTLMPIIGGVAYFLLKRKWFYVAIAIPIVSYLFGSIRLFISEGFHFRLLFYNGYLYLGLIYAGLVILGVVIAFLLKFAFSKEGNRK